MMILLILMKPVLKNLFIENMQEHREVKKFTRKYWERSIKEQI